MVLLLHLMVHSFLVNVYAQMVLNSFFPNPGFALFKGWDSGFCSKIGAQYAWNGDAQSIVCTPCFKLITHKPL